jgi:hypothetical protein
LWNGEDLSIVSVDDHRLPSVSALSTLPSANPSTASFGQKPGSYSGTTLSESPIVNPSNIKDVLKVPPLVPKPQSSADDDLTSHPGYRAAEAWVRPSPVATVGDVVRSGFDLKSVTFTFGLVADHATQESVPTEIFLPDFHFPPGKTSVEVSGGRWRIDAVDVDGEGMQTLKWWHGAGEQTMTVRGVKRKPGNLAEEDDREAGYLDTITASAQNCVVM